MNEKTIELLCQILGIKEEEFIKSYLNTDEVTKIKIIETLSNHKIKSEELLKEVTSRLSKETGLAWTVLSNPKFKIKNKENESHEGTTWLENKDEKLYLYFYNKNLEKDDIDILEIPELLDTNPVLFTITKESILSIIEEQKEEIITQLHEITQSRKEILQARIKSLSNDLEVLKEEKEETIKEQLIEEKKVKDFTTTAYNSRKKIQDAINSSQCTGVTINDILTIKSNPNSEEEFENYARILRMTNRNVNNYCLQKYNFVYETELGIKGKTTKKIPEELLELIQFYKTNFKSIKNYAKFIKKVMTESGYEEFKNTAEEYKRLLKEVSKINLSQLDINFEEYKESMFEDFKEKINNPTQRKDLIKKYPADSVAWLTKYGKRKLTSDELLIEFNKLWNKEKEQNRPIDSTFKTAMLGYLNYMRNFQERTNEMIKYIGIYQIAKKVSQEDIENYKRAFSGIDYKRNCLSKNTCIRTDQLVVLTKRITSTEKRLQEYKDKLLKISLEESELLDREKGKTKKDESNKTYEKENQN